jgi:hypothetical protein
MKQMSKYLNQWCLFLVVLPLLMGFCYRLKGIKGHVSIEKGNQMPLKGKSSQNSTPYATVVYVYAAAKTSQLIQQDGQWAKGIKARMLYQIKTNKLGQFKRVLPPGKYSILVQHTNGLYIPYFSGIDEVAIIEVKKGLFQEIDITIAAPSLF